MARIFISFTDRDKLWERWINARLRKLGHDPLSHADFPGGLHILKWMHENISTADRFLAVCSPRYFSPEAAHSATERDYAERLILNREREAAKFMLIVEVKRCASKQFLGDFRYISLYDRTVNEARALLDEYVGNEPLGQEVPAADNEPDFPPHEPISNIPIQALSHYFGRKDTLKEIDDALDNYPGRISAVALTGMHGLGKSTAVAAYADEYCKEYRATWWIRADDEVSMTADLVALGICLKWVRPDENQKEDVDVSVILRRIENDGEDILLIYDNVRSPENLMRFFMPHRGAARALITSNTPALGGLARRIELKLWPKELGAEYLLTHTGPNNERADAEALSEAFDGLPLALALIAGFCDKSGRSLAELRSGYADVWLRAANPLRQAIVSAIDEAAKRHPGAEPLLKYAALLEPEPIPSYLFSEGADFIGEHSLHFKGNALDDAIAALRDFALVDRKYLPDQKNPEDKTDCMRLHRVVRDVAAACWTKAERTQAHAHLIAAMSEVYPLNDYSVISTWPRARRLDAHARALVDNDVPIPEGSEDAASELMDKLAAYCHASDAAYAQARRLFKRAHDLRLKAHGVDHPLVATSLNHLALLDLAEGNFESARSQCERALAIRKRAHGPNHPDVASSLINLARILGSSAQPSLLQLARRHCNSALKIYELVRESDHPDIAYCLTTVVRLLLAERKFKSAEPLGARALAIYEKAFEPNHPVVATALTNLADAYVGEGDEDKACPYLKRALAIHEKVLGPTHATTVAALKRLTDICDGSGNMNANTR
ncbi:toll/interleukin-1 receptor domain-containing protein [Paraburkholderia domus]|jgi:Tfp pilus assembly protein PilF|uniref:tetratricopeptide repeat protein n=1 Tax=Paraburkholderia domus TaxID=2793075 RepID=UPI00191445BB|nr:toll/interleukin-1 receptor domain-containing protein [Paraburkholderia domus]MBK5065676.1 toll/interleukin-1 receptor domain-containing protein [Burkholderia sp. R-70199]CAE6960881.1 hypothetical protein R70199_07311 [Paraburkholderia domus]